MTGLAAGKLMKENGLKVMVRQSEKGVAESLARKEPNWTYMTLTLDINFVFGSMLW